MIDIDTLVFPEWLQIVFVGLIGLALGSFGTMLLYRLPRQETMMGRSQCTACRKTLHWYDLIPILSFVLLGGKCHYCGKAISWRYPFTEVVTAFTLVLVTTQMDHSGPVALLLLAACVYFLVLIGFYDFDTQRIPDVFVMVLLFCAVLYQAFVGASDDPTTMRDAFIGAAIPFGFFGTLWTVSNHRWIGSGDILLGTAIGMMLGMEGTLLALFFAYVMGAFAAVMLIALNLVKGGSTMPFGPFLVSGALLSLFSGEAFLYQYERLFFLL